jgi:hypothetical protein
MLVPNLLTKVLVATLPSMLQEKISDKKIEAETKVLRAQDQSVYFFSRLNQLRAAHGDERRNRNPIKTIRRRMSSSSVGASSSICSGTVRTDEDDSIDNMSVNTLTYTL